jgi:hypothetical protein
MTSSIEKEKKKIKWLKKVLTENERNIIIKRKVKKSFLKSLTGLG